MWEETKRKLSFTLRQNENKNRKESDLALLCITICKTEDKEMGLTNSRRWWRREETSTVHPSSANNIDEKKETNNQVCFYLIYEYITIVKKELLPFVFFLHIIYVCIWLDSRVHFSILIHLNHFSYVCNFCFLSFYKYLLFCIYW